MKINFKFATVLMAVAILAVACQKETEMAVPQEKKDLTAAKIMKFEKKLKNPDKSGETLSVDSAVWYAEALANFVYCRRELFRKYRI